MQGGAAPAYLGAMKNGFRLVPLVLVFALPACDRVTGLLGGSAPPPQSASAAPAPAPAARIAPAGARTAAAYDRTTAEERAAATAKPAGGAELGKVVVSLGNPAEQGFWLRSALVAEKRAGSVKLASGASVAVDLLPLQGGGAQLSLAAYRALGLALTELPSVTVLGR